MITIIISIISIVAIIIFFIIFSNRNVCIIKQKAPMIIRPQDRTKLPDLLIDFEDRLH